MTLLPAMEELHKIQCTLQDLISNSLELINEYGDVIALPKKEKLQDEVVHDFIFFCFTKGTKSLMAIDSLLTEAYIEDAKILARSAYESYLNGAYILEHPENVNFLVAAKVGTYFGHYKHPVSKKGKKIVSKMILPSTKEIVDIKVTLKMMAEGTYNKNDANVHENLYSFFSEFAHIHMMASGSYRTGDNARYTTETSTDGIYATLFLCLYIAWLLFDMVITYLYKNTKNLDEIINFRNSIKSYLGEILEQIEFVKELELLKLNMKNRLKGTQ